jgi:photosystem II stability/assembly factor-like uncharacterized protein
VKSHWRGRSRAAASATTVFQRLLLLCCCLPALATASVDQWTTIGPRGAALRQVVEDPANPSVLYVDDGSVLYRSQNAGASWAPTPTWPTLDPGCVNSYFFPRNGSIYALACGEILWRSTDGGNTWQDQPPPPHELAITTSDPSNPQVVYGIAFLTGAVKSVDGGATWVSLPTGVPLIGGWTGMIVDQMSPSTVYIFGPSSILKSTDAGAHWSPANVGLPSNNITGLVQVGSTLVAATGDAGVFRSLDGAATWLAATTGLSSFQLGRLVVSPAPSPVLFTFTSSPSSSLSRFFRSDDSGDTWTLTGTLNRPANIAVSSLSSSVVYAATVQGFAVSRDGTMTWAIAPPTSGLPSVFVTTILIDSGNSSVLYANAAPFSNDGLRSADRGQGWSPLVLADGSSLTALSASTARAGNVYGQQCGSNGCQAYRSTDIGVDWLPLVGAPSGNFVSILEDRSDPNILYAAGNRGVEITPRLGGAAPFVLRSSDGGATWIDASNGLPTALAVGALGSIAVDPSDANTLYAGVGNRLYKTINGGALWAASGAGLPDGWVSAMLVDPLHPSVVYAGIGTINNGTAASGVYVSMDGGTTWSPRTQGLAYVTITALAIDPSNPSTLYAGTSGEGMFRTTNGGLSWAPINYGLKTAATLTINGIAVDPADGRNLYVATNAGAFTLTIDRYGSFVPVIEFYAPGLDRYFMASEVQADVAALDSGAIQDWVRTGQSFKAYPVAAPGASPVCRYYIPPQFGDSHFYSASPEECALVQQRFPQLVLESSAAFYIVLPDTTSGACPTGTIPVFRLWNARVDSNHRYTTDPAIKAQMIAKGHIPEGYGPNQVIMCALQ